MSAAEKYSRQVLFAAIGRAGQEKLGRSRVIIIGCGALGTAQANALVRAGVGRLQIVDRDFVEESNLQRQTLFDEADAREALPKAVAAERKLAAINSEVQVEGVVADVTPENIEELVGGFDLILDGTDNFETRYLINDVAVKNRQPWVYGAVVGSYGVTMTIVPEQTPCFTCLMETTPESALQETCDTVGVIGPAVNLIASIQVAEALKLLTGVWTAEGARLVAADVWENRYQAIRLPVRFTARVHRERQAGLPELAQQGDCRTCGHREFRYLAGEAQPHLTMCGRDSVQIHERRRRVDLEQLRARLAPLGSVRQNAFLLRFFLPPYELTVFPDGRAIIKGTREPAVARSLYAKYVGA